MGRCSASGLQILSQRENVSGLVQRGPSWLARTSSFSSPRPKHQPRLGRNFRMRFLGTPQQLQRPLVHRAFAHLPIEPRHRLSIVIENIRPHGQHHVLAHSNRRENPESALPLLQPGTRRRISLDRARKNVRAAVGLVVAVHGSHQPRSANPILATASATRNGSSSSGRAHRLARRHRAKSASSRANVPQNHERRRAMLPALAHVSGTARLSHTVCKSSVRIVRFKSW